jgi:hypothetical protein
LYQYFFDYKTNTLGCIIGMKDNYKFCKNRNILLVQECKMALYIGMLYIDHYENIIIFQLIEIK